jgi:hypothetical protein
MSTLSKIKITMIIPTLLGLLLFIFGGIIAYTSYNLTGVHRAFGPLGVIVAISGLLVIIAMER